MLKKISLTLLTIYFGYFKFFSQEKKPIEIAFLGTFHFSQFHNESKEDLNFYGAKKQKEIKEVLRKLTQYNPDRIYLEREPNYQKQIDSTFSLFNNGKVRLEDFEAGSGEVYQIGFNLAKQLKHEKLYCVNYYESVSQGLIANGENIDFFKNALVDFQQLGRSVVGNFLNGNSSLIEALELMNLPENISMSHKLLFNTPAYIKNGDFKTYKDLPQSEKNIDRQYIGAEFISLFYERNLKIYSNILNEQLNSGGKRILFITGQVHVGVLQELFKNNENYKVIPVHEFLK